MMLKVVFCCLFSSGSGSNEHKSNFFSLRNRILKTIHDIRQCNESLVYSFILVNIDVNWKLWNWDNFNYYQW